MAFSLFTPIIPFFFIYILLFIIVSCPNPTITISCANPSILWFIFSCFFTLNLHAFGTVPLKFKEATDNILHLHLYLIKKLGN